ncbi:MAG: hypothetical protein HY289_11025 [Planctomycetes bacterium]|nr:hypothetical protein [Planctomycetota bacterium]
MPNGLQVSPAGLVTWRVPSEYADAGSDFVLSVRSASGQETFQTFTIRLLDD